MQTLQGKMMRTLTLDTMRIIAYLLTSAAVPSAASEPYRDTEALDPKARR